MHRHPVNHEIEHLDFYQVDLLRMVHADVPVLVTGEAPAVHTYNGVLLAGLAHVAVEALPAAMPTHLEVSVESITELDGEVTVADLQVPPGVTILTPPDTMLARVSAQRGAEPSAVPEGEQPAGARVNA